MEREDIMMHVKCPCGANYQVLNEKVAEKVRCPKCNARASDVLGLTEPEPVEPTAFRVPCPFHPDQFASNNCLNCGKPLCMECVREKGYYCSAACKGTVSAMVPDAVTPEARAAVANTEEVEETIEKVKSIAKKVIIGAVVAGALAAVWSIVAYRYAPKGQIVATMSINAPGKFGFRPSGNGVVLQTGDEISLVSLPGMQKVWTVKIRPMEEKYEPPKQEDRPGAENIMAEAQPNVEHRDPLMLAEVESNSVVIASRRQIIVLERENGAVRWQNFDPKAQHYGMKITANGIWCPQGNPPQYANLSLADGSTSFTLETPGISQVLCVGERAGLLSQPELKAAKRGLDDFDDNEELTVGSIHDFDPKSIMAQARGKRVRGKQVDFQVTLVSAVDGHVLGEAKMKLEYGARLIKVGSQFAVVSGQDLFLLKDDASTLWKKDFSATIAAVESGGGMLLVATDSGITALDGKTGEEKWTRAGLPARKVVCSPDGQFYATITISKDESTTGEAKDYRHARVMEVGGIGGSVEDRFRVLLRLDPKNGKTLWGVMNIGDNLFFNSGNLFVLDRIDQVNLIANQAGVGNYSARRLNPRNGDDIWRLLKPGDLYHYTMCQGKMTVVTADDPPTRGGVLGYDLRIIDAK